MQSEQSIKPADSAGSIVNRRNLIRLYVALVAFYWASLYFYVPTLPVYVESRVNNLAAVGTILSMYGLWQALIRFPLGIAADWAGKRKPFIVAGFVLAALGAWVMSTATSGFGLGAGRAITGLAAGAWVLLTVVFSTLFPPDEAVRATALLTVVNSLSRMAATSITGWLNGLGGYQLAFYVAAGVALASAVLMVFVKEEPQPRRKVNFSTIWDIMKRPDVLRPSLLGALAQYVTWSATLSFTPILAARLEATDMVQSLLTSGSIGIVTIGNMLTATMVKRTGNRNLAWFSFILLAGGALLAALSPNLIVLFIAQFIASIGSGVAHPLFMGLSIAKVEGGQRATAMGLHQAIYGFGMFAGPYISGAIAQCLGIQPMFGITAFLCVVLGWLGVRWLRSAGIE